MNHHRAVRLQSRLLVATLDLPSWSTFCAWQDRKEDYLSTKRNSIVLGNQFRRVGGGTYVHIVRSKAESCEKSAQFSAAGWLLDPGCRSCSEQKMVALESLLLLQLHIGMSMVSSRRRMGAFVLVKEETRQIFPRLLSRQVEGEEYIMVAW